MWKYVSRRLKETFERTCNAFDLCRTWRCGGGVQQSSSKDDDCLACEEYQIDRKNCIRILPNFYICPVTNNNSNGSSDGGRKENKGRTYQNEFQDDLLGAITWVGKFKNFI